MELGETLRDIMVSSAASMPVSSPGLRWSRFSVHVAEPGLHLSVSTYLLMIPGTLSSRSSLKPLRKMVQVSCPLVFQVMRESHPGEPHDFHMCLSSVFHQGRVTREGARSVISQLLDTMVLGKQQVGTSLISLERINGWMIKLNMESSRKSVYIITLIDNPICHTVLITFMSE